MSVNEKMTAIADAIRGKTGKTGTLTLDQMSTEINSITGLDTDIIEFSQMNEKVAAFLAAADSAYTDANGDSISVIANYETSEGGYDGGYDRPSGCPLAVTSGNLYLQNESNGNGWKLSVGTDHVRKSLFNAIPGVVSQYLVKDANGNLLENGRIKPTGKVRMVRFYGNIRNCRDLGGWACDGGTIKYGKLFRSGVPASGETWIDPLIAKNIGIRHQIDFQGDSEAGHITKSCLGSEVRYQRIPINLYYADSINLASADYENLKKVFHAIMDAAIHDEGVIYNCSLGRDRTGTITFMLLALLGVAKSNIDKDYELTGFSTMNTPAYRTSSSYCAMTTYLSTLGRSTLRDNVVRWFLKAGFSIEELNAFRAAMSSGTPVELKASDYVTVYAVTNALTGCTTSNSATSAYEGANYTATLSFASGNNTFSSVKVTMGGVDVTSNVYANGVINIPSVTGAVVITAVATYVAKYTNQLPIATGTDGAVYDAADGKPGYKDSTRLSSSGVDSGANGMSTTGLIPCSVGSVVRMRGINFNNKSSNYGNHRIAFYNASRTYISNSIVQGASATSELSGQYDSGGDLVQFTVPTTLYTNVDLSSVAYFRICGDTFDSGAIITVNEEIE